MLRNLPIDIKASYSLIEAVAYLGGYTGCSSTPLSSDKVQYSIWLKQG